MARTKTTATNEAATATTATPNAINNAINNVITDESLSAYAKTLYEEELFSEILIKAKELLLNKIGATKAIEKEKREQLFTVMLAVDEIKPTLRSLFRN